VTSPIPLAATGEAAKSGPLGLAVILALCIACYFLFKSMSKHLRKVREEFPGQAGREPEPATPTGPTEPGSPTESPEPAEPLEPVSPVPSEPPEPPEPLDPSSPQSNAKPQGGATGR
jgi:hypothetical protein